MSRFQIRFPKDMGLDLWLEHLVEQAWVFRTAETSAYDEFRQSMFSWLSRYIGTFQDCGKLPECTDEIEGGPWLDYDDQIYHLLAPQGFESFIDDLSERTLYLLRRSSANDILPHIRAMFRKSLSEYIYYNPVCGKEDICGDASLFLPLRTVGYNGVTQ